MSNNCWYKLNVNLENCFKEDYTFPKPQGQYGIWHVLARDVFKLDWLKYVSSIGLPVYSVMIFYRGPYAATLGAHVDISIPEPLQLTNFGINWCYGGKDSTMSWYETPTHNDPPITYTPARTAYKVWRKDVLSKIESKFIGEEVTLVRTGLPHSIEMGTDPRWCFSARTSIHDNYEWDKVVDLMRSKNLLIERDVQKDKL